MFDSFLGPKKLAERKSKFNGKVGVLKNLALGTYLQVDGITQSGGIVENIWKTTLNEIKKKNKNQDFKNCLILGFGGGTLARLINKIWPKMKITGIDIDPVIVQMGKKYLGKFKNTKIEICDALSWILKNKKQDFDLVIIDLYQGRQFPSQFGEEKFLRLLTKFKVVVFNRLYYGEKRAAAVKFGKKLEKIYSKVEYFYPEANLMLICSGN